MAFLGCSRGLGRAVTLEMDRQGLLEKALLSARKKETLANLAYDLQCPSEIEAIDFAQQPSVESLLAALRSHRPQRVFYFAAGGPYGLFAKKAWKDHLWALQVSFLTPSELLHRLLSDSQFDFVKQIIFIGSRIADSQPDPMASSYASAKHGLKGLVESLQGEDLSVDLRFFRPGYMNTDLLPKNAKPRTNEGSEILEPQRVAKDFVKWALDPSGASIYDVWA